MKWWLKNPFRITETEEAIKAKTNEEWAEDIREDVKAILDSIEKLHNEYEYGIEREEE